MSRIDRAVAPATPPTTSAGNPAAAAPSEEASRERALTETAGLVEARAHSTVNRGLKGRVRMGTDVPRAEQPGDVVVVTRSFLPQESVMGFHGDGRGFSTDADDTARIRSGVLLTPDSRGGMRAVRGGARSDETRSDAMQSVFGHVSSPETATPGVTAQSRRRGSSTTVRVNAEAGNPLIPGAPDVDTTSSFTVRSEGNELHIRAHIVGDAFPAAETFVRDHAGNAVFIGVHQLPADGGLSDMVDNNGRPMIDASITIIRDPETQAFVAVESEGQRYTLDEWNQQFEQADALG